MREITYQLTTTTTTTTTPTPTPELVLCVGDTPVAMKPTRWTYPVFANDWVRGLAWADAQSAGQVAELLRVLFRELPVAKLADTPNNSDEEVLLVWLILWVASGLPADDCLLPMLRHGEIDAISVAHAARRLKCQG